MSGRFTLINWEDLILRFGVQIAGLSPLQYCSHASVPVIVAGDKLKIMDWGLIPFWVKEETTGNRLINARAETLAEKKAIATI